MLTLPPDIPQEAREFLEAMGWMRPDALAVGDPAPDVPLLRPDGSPLHSSHLWADRPAVLIFGSYT